MTKTKYEHAEAYCLMTYRSADGTVEEVLWNSRDGVTPFVITSVDGVELRHENWKNDRCVPDYQPPKGSRIFVDLTPEKALEYGKRNRERWIAEGIDPADVPRASELASYYLERPGTPDIAVVE